jgi:hypothetical protein
MPTPEFVSPYATLGGVVWIPRMLGKIRLQAAGVLPEAYQPYLGKGFDLRCLRFLGLDYALLVAHVRQGGTDEEALAWMKTQVTWPADDQICVWNDFLSKRGWRDLGVPPERFQDYKTKYGLGHRADLLTYFDFYEVDEGRKP